ncbi:unnamed protein product [Anisakis simplex]|uniref:ShKT domain-containing protein n=1 Tax=Anisakis simplex TaxID=6269 RepID=A0A3P6NQN6_ANISI|nr:unnamed protein product [Anisakis simplex]
MFIRVVYRFRSGEGGGDGNDGGNDRNIHNYDAVCKDDNPYCSLVKDYICIGPKQFAMNSCRKTCGHCGGEGGLPSPYQLTEPKGIESSIHYTFSATPRQAGRENGTDEHSTQPNDDGHSNSTVPSGSVNDNMEVTTSITLGVMDSVRSDEVVRAGTTDETSTQLNDDGRSTSPYPSTNMHEGTASHDYTTISSSKLHFF